MVITAGTTGETSEHPERELPATFVNRFIIRVGPQVTRISFGEAVAGVDATYHSSFVMLTSDAIELGKLLGALIAKNQELVAQSDQTKIK